MLEFAFDHGALPATLMYRGYRKSTCTSINHVVCHGIPNDKPLKEGDIVNIDVTLILDGWHGDSSRMYRGRRNPAPRRAADRGHLRGDDARHRRRSSPGATTGDIGAAIQTFVEAQHMSVVRDFCGHGLGRLFHDEPNIVHVGRPGEGIVLQPGMFFTVEPMINLGRPHVKVLSDGWTAVTRDRSLSAQFEHTVGVTETGVEIFTHLAQGPRQAALSAAAVPGSGRSALHRSPAFARTLHVRCTARARILIGRVVRCHARQDAKIDRSPASPRRRRIITAIASGCATRFREAGSDAVSDYELLELVLFRAIPQRDVKPLAKELIAKFGSFAEVIAAPPSAAARGQGPRRSRHHRAQDRARRGRAGSRAAQVKKRPVLSSWTAVLDYCRTAMAFADKEQFRILFLDKRNQLIADEVQQTGTVDHTPVYPREVVKRALELSATAIILVHNHPSGDPTPSRADIQMTQAIVEIAKPLGISVHDHIIVGKDGHASLKGLKLI